MNFEAAIIELQQQVQKQQQIIAQTGQQLMELRLAQQRQGLEGIDRRNDQLSSVVKHQSPAFTQDDVVQLVQELQGQLDLIDDRCIRRIINSRASGNTPITPVASQNGEYPKWFPGTALEFVEMNGEQITELCEFYELLPPSMEEVEEMLQKVNMTAEEAGVKREEVSDLDKYSMLAHYVGLPGLR